MEEPPIDNLFYGRDGNPTDAAGWMADSDVIANRVLDQTTLPSGIWISTVWLGLNHNLAPDEPPLIFQTVVFANEEKSESPLAERRYSTESEAFTGHGELCTEWESHGT